MHHSRERESYLSWERHWNVNLAFDSKPKSESQSLRLFAPFSMTINFRLKATTGSRMLTSPHDCSTCSVNLAQLKRISLSLFTKVIKDFKWIGGISSLVELASKANSCWNLEIGNTFMYSHFSIATFIIYLPFIREMWLFPIREFPFILWDTLLPWLWISIFKFICK